MTTHGMSGAACRSTGDSTLRDLSAPPTAASSGSLRTCLCACGEYVTAPADDPRDSLWTHYQSAEHRLWREEAARCPLCGR